MRFCTLLFMLLSACMLMAGCPKKDTTATDLPPVEETAAGEPPEEVAAEPEPEVVDHSQLEVPTTTSGMTLSNDDPSVSTVREMTDALNQYFGAGFRSAFHADAPELAAHMAFYDEFKTLNQEMVIERLALEGATETDRYIGYEFVFMQNPERREVRRISGCISLVEDGEGKWKIMSWDQSGEPCPTQAVEEMPAGEAASDSTEAAPGGQ